MPPSSVLRPLQSSDLATVEVWLRDYVREHRAWWSEAYSAQPESPLEEVVAAERDDLVDYATRDDHFVSVLASTAAPGEAEGGMPLGIVFARTTRDRFMGLLIGTLGWIYVDPVARGSGASARLMAAAEAWFLERGVVGRNVYVTAVNERAVRVYERHGYRVVDYRMLRGSIPESGV